MPYVSHNFKVHKFWLNLLVLDEKNFWWLPIGWHSIQNSFCYAKITCFQRPNNDKECNDSYCSTPSFSPTIFSYLNCVTYYTCCIKCSTFIGTFTLFEKYKTINSIHVKLTNFSYFTKTFKFKPCSKCIIVECCWNEFSVERWGEGLSLISTNKFFEKCTKMQTTKTAWSQWNFGLTTFDSGWYCGPFYHSGRKIMKIGVCEICCKI